MRYSPILLFVIVIANEKIHRDGAFWHPSSCLRNTVSAKASAEVNNDFSCSITVKQSNIMKIKYNAG